MERLVSGQVVARDIHIIITLEIECYLLVFFGNNSPPLLHLHSHQHFSLNSKIISHSPCRDERNFLHVMRFLSVWRLTYPSIWFFVLMVISFNTIYLKLFLCIWTFGEVLKLEFSNKKRQMFLLFSTTRNLLLSVESIFV